MQERLHKYNYGHGVAYKGDPPPSRTVDGRRKNEIVL